jgi:pimeloyl-ACP methyl ester carboxylesterase
MSSLDTPATDATMRLRDGRALAYMEVGQRDQPPIFHFHGSGSSRLEVQFLAAAAIAQGVRLIGLDRPGIGGSDAKSGSRLLDWPDDVLEVADYLGIARFAIQGISAGGAYALACAYKIPHRLTACGLVSTLSPPDLIRKAGPWWMRTVWWLGKQFPGLLESYARLVNRLSGGSDEAKIDRYYVRYAPRLGAADRKLLEDSQLRRLLVKALAENARQGGEANVAAAITGLRPWGFRAEQVTFAHMFLWHGEQDHIMPVAPARLLAHAMPHCVATFYPDEGHFSTVYNHAHDILRTLSR